MNRAFLLFVSIVLAGCGGYGTSTTPPTGATMQAGQWELSLRLPLGRSQFIWKQTWFSHRGRLRLLTCKLTSFNLAVQSEECFLIA